MMATVKSLSRYKTVQEFNHKQILIVVNSDGNFGFQQHKALSSVLNHEGLSFLSLCKSSAIPATVFETRKSERLLKFFSKIFCLELITRVVE